MNDAPRDLRSDLRVRLDVVVKRFAEVVSEYTKKKEELEKDYTTTVSELQAERVALEQLLSIEEKRCGDAQADSAPGKVAKLIALEALDKAFAA
jgi:hypothetical protein